MEILELNHIAIHVKDVDKSILFYKNILGFQSLKRPDFNFPGAWFRLGKFQELHLIGNRKDEIHSMPQGSHFALKCKSLEEVNKFFLQNNLEFIGPKTRPDGVKQIFLKDPDGYFIEFFEEN